MNPWAGILSSNLGNSDTNHKICGKTLKIWSSNVKAIFYGDGFNFMDPEINATFSGYYRINKKQVEVPGGRWSRYELKVFPEVKIYNDTWVEWKQGTWLVKAKHNKLHVMDPDMFESLFGSENTTNDENVIRWEVEAPKEDKQPEVKPEEPSWTKDGCISWGTEKEEEPDKEPELETDSFYEYDGDTTFDPYEKKKAVSDKLQDILARYVDKTGFNDRW